MQSRRMVPLVASIALAASTVFAVAATAPQQDLPPSWAQPCDTTTWKSAEPSTLRRTESAQVTMVMTGTCTSYDLPMDVVFVVDRSNSMTLGTPGGIIDPGPGPIVTSGTPGVDPTEDPKAPTQERPPPTDKPDPDPPTALFGADEAAMQPANRVRGLSGPGARPGAQGTPPGAGTPEPTVDKKETEGRPTTIGPGPGPSSIAPPPDPGIDPTRDLVRRDNVEAPGTEDCIGPVREGVFDFLDNVEPELTDERMRVALVTFNDRARIEVDLGNASNGATQVRSRLFRIRGEGNTRIDLGLSAATRVLYGVTYRGRHDLDFKKVVILYSDGKADPRTTARLRQRDDITYFSVACGRTANLQVMNQLASEREFALDLRDRQELVERVRGLPSKKRSVLFDGVTVSEKIAPGLEYVADSAVPPVTRQLPDGTLQWDMAAPGVPLTVTYQVRAMNIGTFPVSELSEAVWKDSAGRSGTSPFPEVSISVVDLPTATATEGPTATNTPEATATDEPELTPKYLPVALKRFPECHPQTQEVDVALVVDTSDSMRASTQAGGVTKLEAAIGAGLRFLDLMKPNDRSAVVGFNATATLVSPLTGDQTALTVALGQLRAQQAPGTRIDLGLEKGLAELAASARPSSSRAIILVTDGRQSLPEHDASARTLASQARSLGVTVWTIGIGADVDQVLLLDLANRPATYVHAPNAEDLRAVYEDIARELPCP